MGDFSFTEAIRFYDRNNATQRADLLKSIYKNIHGTRNSPEVLVYYASFTCGLAVNMRLHRGVDFHTLRFPIESPPLVSTHPLMLVREVLDLLIEEHLKFISATSADDPRWTDAWAMMMAAFIWKGYLLALSTPPASWGSEIVYSLGSLSILTTANPTQVTTKLRNNTHAAIKNVFDAPTRSAVRTDDWPCRGFIDVYFKNRELLERQLRELNEENTEPANKNSGGNGQTLHRRVRGSAAKEAIQKTRLRTANDVWKAYEKMDHEDFCDVVDASIRSHNLLDEGATLAVYLQEWVDSQADQPFFDWIRDGEGLQRFDLLNREWLQSGVNQRLSFTEWYTSRKRG
jgi:hypothetical protein